MREKQQEKEKDPYFVGEKSMFRKRKVQIQDFITCGHSAKICTITMRAFYAATSVVCPMYIPMNTMSHPILNGCKAGDSRDDVPPVYDVAA